MKNDRTVGPRRLPRPMGAVDYLPPVKERITQAAVNALERVRAEIGGLPINNRTNVANLVLQIKAIFNAEIARLRGEE